MSQQKVLESEPDCKQLTLFPEDSLVSHFPWLESKKEKKTIVTYGRKCLELSESFRQLGYSVRTYLESCPLPATTFARIWSVKATKSGYLILKLRLSEQNTGENVSSLWATPNTMDSLPSRSYEAMKRQATIGGRKNRKRPGNLREQIDPLMNMAYIEASLEANNVPEERWAEEVEKRVSQMWPTPTCRDSRPGDAKNRQGGKSLVDTVMYPTPATGAGLCGGTGNFQQLHKLKDAGVTTEEERRNMSQGNGGRLNPTWVEWLMGFPLGWTDLEA